MSDDQNSDKRNSPDHAKKEQKEKTGIRQDFSLNGFARPGQLAGFSGPLGQAGQTVKPVPNLPKPKVKDKPALSHTEKTTFSTEDPNESTDIPIDTNPDSPDVKQDIKGEMDIQTMRARVDKQLAEFKTFLSHFAGELEKVYSSENVKLLTVYDHKNPFKGVDDVTDQDKYPAEKHSYMHAVLRDEGFPPFIPSIEFTNKQLANAEENLFANHVLEMVAKNQREYLAPARRAFTAMGLEVMGVVDQHVKNSVMGKYPTRTRPA